MKLETRIFEFYGKEYRDLPELANAMGVPISHLYQVREGTCHINDEFIIGAKKAFPNYELGDLFYLVPAASYLSSAKVEHSIVSAHEDYSVFRKKQIQVNDDRRR